ncbi:helix-turn-helix domain-containing protein [Streptomyces sp. NPDC058108]|uniref:helix-turn-helix domain-containing protein n=1 Tax=Streptomyces sp. NPDC058108 TaxID=3346344 RepID=UPI0036E9E60B
MTASGSPSAGRTSPPPVVERATDFADALHLTARQIERSARPFEEWENSPFAHLKSLAIPRPDAARGFRFAAKGHLFKSLLSVKVYCDSLTGLSGSGQEKDPIVADLVASGSLRFEGKHGENVVGPGQLCIRDTKASWQFTCAPGTRIRVVTIPRQLVPFPHGSFKAFDRAFVADVASPHVRFLTHFLEAIEKSSEDLDQSPFTQDLALNTCATLLSGLLHEQGEKPFDEDPPATLEAARSAIEKHLDRRDLSPAVIAGLVGVSVRTLHRSFADADDTVMAFTRRRRLERAHDELMTKGPAVNVSELAARWHFADASHFIKHFRSSYGASPTAYLRSRTTSTGDLDRP